VSGMHGRACSMQAAAREWQIQSSRSLVMRQSIQPLAAARTRLPADIQVVCARLHTCLYHRLSPVAEWADGVNQHPC
jgi:hypothetical protein